jgi:hypothetical protein
LPTLSRFFALYTQAGAAPRTDIPVPRGATLTLEPLTEVVLPGAETPIFGPHVQAFLAAPHPGSAWLLSIKRESRGGAGSFFAETQQSLRATLKDLNVGFGLDVLRLWPFPFTAVDTLPEDPFAEDLISVGFTESGEHGFRAETFGLAAFQQRELSFAFHGQDLLEEATVLCAHLADYVMGRAARVEHGHAMSFGFDKLVFSSPHGQASGPFRGWHPPFIQRVLSPEAFPGVGVLETLCTTAAGGAAQADLTPALQRAFSQRQVLDEHRLTGESPHQSDTVTACACAAADSPLYGHRDEPAGSRHSGWKFHCLSGHPAAMLGTVTLGELARRVPQIIPWLSLPPGCSVTWNNGSVTVDTRRARRAAEDDVDD